MSNNGMRAAPPERGFHAPQRLVVLGIILLSVALLSLGDFVDDIPLFAPLAASPLFPFFHKIHDLLALAILLYIPYKYSVRLGLAAVLIFIAAHILHGFTSDEAPMFGSILFVAGFGMWIIHRMHQSEGLMRQTEEYLELQFERMPIGMIVYDTDFHVRSWNPAAAKIFGFSREEILGKHPYGLIVPKAVQPQVDDIWRRLLQGDMTAHGINENTTKDGRTITCEWLNTPLKSVNGHTTSVLSMVQDITERKKAENALRQLNEELETFAYTAAHDLKAPLVTIQGFAAMLRSDLEKKRTERFEEDISLIEAGVSKMQALLNRTLEYGRAGRRIEKPAQPIPLKEIIQDSLEQVAGQIHLSGASISVADNFPSERVDRMAMVQVFSNLIQNSTLYRDKNKPLTIEIGHRESDGEVIYFVRDNGIGISPAQVSKVFEPFYRGASQSPGTGLGLTIVKRIVEGHGGRVWIESEAGKGTKVCFTLTNHKDEGV